MWEVNHNRRLLYGCKKIREIAGIFQWYNLKRIFIITYSADASALSVIKKDLNDRNISYLVYDKVIREPDLPVIDEGAGLALSEGCDGVLAIGGGSVLDAAKAIAMLVTNGGAIEEYQMSGRPVLKETLPLIAVPTTSGTGSEATRVSVVYNNKNHQKKSIYSPCMIADVTILDPEVTIDLPARITASTGMDALSHAVESYVSLNATPYTEMYSLKAMELIEGSLYNAVNHGEDLKARSDMMLGSYMAGCALAAGIGLAHIIAQPIGGLCKIPHGDACSIFLPLSMELNLEYSLEKYKKIGEILGDANTGENSLEAGKAAISKVRSLIDSIGAPKHLADYLQGSELDYAVALETISGSTGHIKCNPRPVDRDLLLQTLKLSV
jgi:alcohol dehydrogenase class IV